MCYNRSLGHWCYCCCWYVSQLRRKAKFITYKELKWNRVLKAIKSVHCSHCLCFSYCISSEVFLVALWWTPLSPPFLFQPTCQSVNIQQSLKSPASDNVQSGSWRIAPESLGWLKTHLPTLSGWKVYVNRCVCRTIKPSWGHEDQGHPAFCKLDLWSLSFLRCSFYT